MFVFLLLLLSEMTMTTAQNMDRIRRLKVTDNTDAHLLAFLSLRKCSPNCVVQVQRAMFNVYNGIRRKRRWHGSAVLTCKFCSPLFSLMRPPHFSQALLQPSSLCHWITVSTFCRRQKNYECFSFPNWNSLWLCILLFDQHIIPRLQRKMHCSIKQLLRACVCVFAYIGCNYSMMASLGVRWKLFITFYCIQCARTHSFAVFPRASFIS